VQRHAYPAHCVTGSQPAVPVTRHKCVQRGSSAR
jgi:hypothetical protein